MWQEVLGMPLVPRLCLSVLKEAMSITRGRTKPTLAHRRAFGQYGKGLTPKRSKRPVVVGSGVSWWTDFARGERRGETFQREALRRFPGTTARDTGPILTRLTDD